MRISIPYHNSFLHAELDEALVEAVITPKAVEPMQSPKALVLASLENPICSKRLCELAKGKQKITLITCDHTRAMPSKVTLPIILKELRKGNPNAEITILIATGLHRPTTSQELHNMFGAEIVQTENILVSDAYDEAAFVDFGRLPSGAPFELHKAAAECDLLISEGFIEPHFFAGYSGGRKSVLPGVCSGRKCVQKPLPLCSLIYLPAVISVFGYCLLDFAKTQYNLTRARFGWINLGVQSNLDMFFNIHYISYVLLSIAILWMLRRKAQDGHLKKQASLILVSVAAALVIGTITDVILSTYMGGPLPQMAPLFTLLPVAAVFYSVRRLELMRVSEVHEELMLRHETRAKLYITISLAFFAGGSVSGLAYFLPGLINSEASRQTMLYASVMLFVLGVMVFLFQFLRAEKAKEALILTATLFSIPVITLMFIEYASITIWVYPLILMMISLIFSTRTPLVLFGLTTAITQLLVWMYAPKTAIDMDEIDYLLRIGIVVIAYFVGSFVNTTYIKRLRENMEQLEFQKLISDISFDFVSVSQENIEQKMERLLKKAGLCFGADLIYVYLINDKKNAVVRAYEWYKDEADKAQAEEEFALDEGAWWVRQLGLEVLAKGVETKPQLEFLNKKMCDEAQGFYYYHPMPKEKIEKLLKESMETGLDHSIALTEITYSNNA